MRAIKSKALRLTMTALFAVVIALCSVISIPAPIPFTLQAFGVASALLLLGGKHGTAATAIYILLGAIGLPVFHGFSGGIGIITGPTGGYLLGFLAFGLTYWLITAKRTKKHTKPFALGLGLIVCYIVGTLWYCRFTENFFTALCTGTLPFVIPDIIKIVLACIIEKRLKPYANFSAV